MVNSLNVISLYHASSLREAAFEPIVTATMQGSFSAPCVMDIADKLEQSETLLGDRFDSTLLVSGSGARQRIDIKSNSTDKFIDSPATQLPEAGPVTSSQLADHVASHWKNDSYNLLHVRAHGHAQQDVMGMPTEDFVAGIKAASLKIGHRIPTLLLESCLMCNLEVVSGLIGSVDTLVASQEVLNAKAFDHPSMFSAALDGSMQPEEVAKRLVVSAQEHRKADTLLALDLNKLGDVTTAVKHFKNQLAASDDKSLTKKTRKALKASAPFPRRHIETSLRRKLDVRDLGEIASNLQKSDLGSPLTESAKTVRDTLQLATIALENGPGYEQCSGLSVTRDSFCEPSKWNIFGLF